MKRLESVLEKYRGKKLLAVFPHPDDESFVAGGLFQILPEYSIHSYMVCLTGSERGINDGNHKDLKSFRTEELKKAVKILGINEYVCKNYDEAKLKQNKKWIAEISNLIGTFKPHLILTFDTSGITGHPDHLIVNSAIKKLVKDSKNIKLLVRVPDETEIGYFRENKALKLAEKPEYVLHLPFWVAIKKIRAIFTHGSQLKNFVQKLQLIEWYLFDNKEMYSFIDPGKTKLHKLVIKKA